MRNTVLFITNFKPNIGGISGQVEILSKKLTSVGVKNEIFNSGGSLFRRLALPVSLMRISRKYDIFHLHGCSNLGFFPIVLGVLMGRLLGKKIVVTYHGGGAEQFFSKYPAFVKTILGMADHIIVLSAFLERAFSKYDLKTIVIPNILANALQPPFRKYVEPKLITTRSLNPIYDIKTAIKAFALVQEKYPNASLKIVGSGTCEEDLKNYVLERGLSGVTFVGRVANERIYEQLQAADIWCNPTTVDNMPVSLLEAINAGLIVVTTNAGGIPSMVTDKSAYMVNVGDYNAMALAVIKIIEDQKGAELVQQEARKVLSYYFWEAHEQKILGVYGINIKRKPADASPLSAF